MFNLLSKYTLGGDQKNKPTLVLAHNKTLAGQLYSQFKELFPKNRVEHFVSYYEITLKCALFNIV